MNKERLMWVVICVVGLIVINLSMVLSYIDMKDNLGKQVDCYDKHNNLILNQVCEDVEMDINLIIMAGIIINIMMIFAIIFTRHVLYKPLYY